MKKTTSTNLAIQVAHASFFKSNFLLAAIEREFSVDRTMDAEIKQRLVSLPRWRGFNNPWMPEDDSDVDYSYINLEVNPERFTGYKVGKGIFFRHSLSLGRQSQEGLGSNLFSIMFCR